MGIINLMLSGLKENRIWVECTWQEAIKQMCTGNMAKAVFTWPSGETAEYIYKKNADGEFKLYDMEKGVFKEQYMDADDIQEAKWFFGIKEVIMAMPKDHGRKNVKEKLEERYSKMEEESMKAERPPLGLVPRYIRQEERLKEINEALQRYITAVKPIPSEWVEEKLYLEAILEVRKKKYEKASE